MTHRRDAFANLPALFVSAVLFATPALAAPPTSWEPVPRELLAETHSPIQQDADAEYVFWKVWVTDELTSSGLKQTRDHYIRVKIFTQEGAQTWSRIDIDSPANKVRLDDLQVRTIQPDGTIIPFDKKALIAETVARRGRFSVRRRSYAPRGVIPGSLVEYRYRETRYDEAAIIQQHRLQLDLPVRTLAYYLRPVAVPDLFVRQTNFHSTARTSSSRIDGYDETIVTNLPAFRREPDSPPELQERPWMLIYYTQDELRSPDEYWAKFGREMATWFDTYTRPDADVKAMARTITGDATTPEDRMRRLADWMERDFRIARGVEKDPAKNDGPRDALSQQGGTERDAAFAFATLARGAGLDTRLVMVPVRDELFFDKRMMLPFFVPAVQIGVRVNDQWQCLHPGGRFLSWDMVPWTEEGEEGVLCDLQSSGFVPTSAPKASRSVIRRHGTFQLSEDGTLEGDVTLSLSGHFNEDFRSMLDGSGRPPDSTVISQSFGPLTGLHISNVGMVAAPDNEREPVRITCHVRFPDHATVTGKRIILEPAAFQLHRPARFAASQRKQPVYFEYAWTEQDSIVIRIPEGWRHEPIVNPAPLEDPANAVYNADLTIDAAGRALIYRRLFQYGGTGGLLIPASRYSGIKQLFDQVRERDATAVILVREDGTH